MLKQRKRMITKTGTYSLILLLIIAMTSCASPEKIVYFQEVEGLQLNDTILNFEPTIQVDDMLTINVSAVDAEAALPFNLYETPILSTSISNAKPINYLVNADGEIHFPVIGKLQVAGLTTRALNVKLETILSSYIKNPIINIRLMNFKVTVTGEVLKPGTFNIPNERVSVLEAISMAGDMTIYGERTRVLLIREQNGKRVFVTLDLTNKKIFESPYFYLAQNDALYIEPNKTRVNSSAVGPNTGVIVSSISLLITVLALIIK